MKLLSFSIAGKSKGKSPISIYAKNYGFKAVVIAM